MEHQFDDRYEEFGKKWGTLYAIQNIIMQLTSLVNLKRWLYFWVRINEFTIKNRKNSGKGIEDINY